MKKNITIGIILIILMGIGIYLFTRSSDEMTYKNELDEIEQNESETGSGNENESAEINDDRIITPESTPGAVTIGSSVEGREIVAHRFGTGETEVLFVGGIHGGYSWNTALLGYELVEYFEDNPDVVPEGVTATVVPVLNPDGLESVVGVDGPFVSANVTATDSQKVAGRFNANNVDLNRNFDCDWESTATWQNQDVDGGSAPFSEPESAAIQNYIHQYNVDATVVYYSSAGGVYASNCHSGVLPETANILNAYADASGYQAYEEFDFYEITGDMTNWLAREGIPAISILLTDHENTEWSKNRAGVNAVLNYYAN